MADPPIEEPVVLALAPIEARAAAGPLHPGMAPARAIASPPPASQLPTSQLPAGPAPVPPAVNDVPAPVEADLELQEIQGVAAAEHVLASDPARALALVRESEARVAGGYLSEERRYIAVVALSALGRTAEAQAHAARFLHDYPGGPFTARVRAAAERQGETVAGAPARSPR
jgi:hypothetical protein